MKHIAIETRMRALEHYHKQVVLPGTFIVIRVDGRSFSRLTDPDRFKKPFDDGFHQAMVETSRVLLDEFQGLYSYTESDEISVLLPKNEIMFDREVEKLVSVSAGIASSVFTDIIHVRSHFDSRLWLGVSEENVVDYFRWRAADAARCCINAWCYWTLRKEGKSSTAASKELLQKGIGYKHELLHLRNINFATLPSWQKNGTGTYFEEYEKVGFNPIKNIEVKAKRRRIKVDEDLPRGADYDQFILARIKENRFLPDLDDKELEKIYERHIETISDIPSGT